MHISVRSYFYAMKQHLEPHGLQVELDTSRRRHKRLLVHHPDGRVHTTQISHDGDAKAQENWARQDARRVLREWGLT